MPFGCGSCSDKSAQTSLYPCMKLSHQCLSAVGPVRTRNLGVGQAPARRVTSAFRLWVLFGPHHIARGRDAGDIVTSAFRLWVLFGPTRRSSVATKGRTVTSAFRLWVLFGRVCVYDVAADGLKSPVPFGCGSCSDISRPGRTRGPSPRRHQCLSAVGPVRTNHNLIKTILYCRTVTSAFRLWVLFGLESRAVSLGYALAVTSAFRLWVLFGPHRRRGEQRHRLPSHQCLSAVGPVRTGRPNRGAGAVQLVTSAFRLWVLFGLPVLPVSPGPSPKSPVPFGCGSCSDTESSVSKAPPRSGSLVPFGCGSCSDPKPEQKTAKFKAAVTSAFRLWVLFGRL